MNALRRLAMTDDTPPETPKKPVQPEDMPESAAATPAPKPDTESAEAAPPPAAAERREAAEIRKDMPPASDLEAAKYAFPPMHPEGRKFVVIAAILALFFWFVVDWEILGWLTAGLGVWIFAFFRDPPRVTPSGDDLILSPADGMVSHIVTVPAPRELAGQGMLEDAEYTRVSVFMSVFDVHVNRSPIAGTIRRVVYVPGKFVNAELDKASEHNERQYFLMEAADGTRVGFTQIAGLVARRIVKFVGEGTDVEAGERIGLIRFGSRVDVFLPSGFAPSVAVGQRAIAGETVLALRGGTRVTGVRG